MISQYPSDSSAAPVSRLARAPTRELTRRLVGIASTSRCAGKPESFRQRPRSYPRLVNSVGHLPIVFRHFQQSGTLRRWQVFTRDDFAIDGVGLETYCQFARRPNCHGCPPDPKPEFTLGQGWTPRPRNSIPGGCGLRGQPLPSGGFGQDQLQGTASGLGRLLGGLDALGLGFRTSGMQVCDAGRARYFRDLPVRNGPFGYGATVREICPHRAVGQGWCPAFGRWRPVPSPNAIRTAVGTRVVVLAGP